MLETTSETAADVMSRDIAVVGPDTSLAELLRLLAERRISGCPVLDEHGSLLGMVSEGDVIRWHDGADGGAESRREAPGAGRDHVPAAVDRPGAPRGRVRAIMRTTDIVTVTEDTPARDIEALMTTRGIKRVPVLREGRVVGIVARSDLVRLLARILDARGREAELAPLTRPRPATVPGKRRR